MFSTRTSRRIIATAALAAALLGTAGTTAASAGAPQGPGVVTLDPCVFLTHGCTPDLGDLTNPVDPQRPDGPGDLTNPEDPQRPDGPGDLTNPQRPDGEDPTPDAGPDAPVVANPTFTG